MPASLNKYLDPAALDETVVNIRELIEVLEAEMQDLPYARPDGIYPDMTVGAVIGADETAQWATRESTGTGSAIVRNVKGAAVAWNQLNRNNTFSSESSGVTFTKNSDGSWMLNGTATANVSKPFDSGASLVAQHKYLVRGCPSGGSANTYFMGFGGLNIDFGSGGIWTNPSYLSSNLRIDIKSGESFDNVTIWPQYYDLTAMFGAGNEPQSVAEFEAMYPASYYPYSAPTLKPVRIAGIASADAQGGELDAIEWTAQTLRAAGSVADMLYSDHVDVKVGVVTLTGNESLTAYRYSTYSGYFVSGALNENGDRKAYSSSDFGSAEQGTMVPNTNQFAWLGVNNKLIYLLWADCPYATSTDAKAWLAQRYEAGNPVTFFYELATPTTQPISPALPMTYKVQAGGSESIIVPAGEVSAAPVLTVAEPVNAGDEFARIWAAIQSLGYTRNTAQLSRPVSLTDIGSIDEVQKDTTDVVEIDTTKEVTE